MSVIVPIGVQRRGGLRQRSLLAGKLTSADASVSIDCTIRDLSEEGAQVVTPASNILPRPLRLLLIKDGVAWEAEVAWRRGDRVGLKLSERRELHGAVDPELRPLRAIWSQMALR